MIAEFLKRKGKGPEPLRNCLRVGVVTTTITPTHLSALKIFKIFFKNDEQVFKPTVCMFPWPVQWEQFNSKPEVGDNKSQQFNVKFILSKCWDRIFFCVPKTWTNGFVRFSVRCLPAMHICLRWQRLCGLFYKKWLDASISLSQSFTNGFKVMKNFVIYIAKCGSSPTVISCLGLVEKSQNLIWKKVPALKLRWSAYFLTRRDWSPQKHQSSSPTFLCSKMEKAVEEIAENRHKQKPVRFTLQGTTKHF